MPLVVELGLGDRLLEDRRVGGHPAQVILVDQPLELAARVEIPADVVEPDALAELGQSLEWILGHLS